MSDLDSKIRSTILLALSNLGLSEDFLIRALHLHGIELPTDNVRANYSHINVLDFLWLCEFLHIPTEWELPEECIRTFQAHSVGEAIIEGRFTFPVTPKTKELFKGYLLQKKSTIRSNKRIYANPLLKKVIMDRRKAVLTVSRKRKLNREKFLKEKEFFHAILHESMTRSSGLTVSDTTFKRDRKKCLLRDA